MVIVKLAGGLGNQLFQYATGRAISYRNNVPLKLDVTELARDPLRDYRLDFFNISASVASLFEVQHLTGGDWHGIRSKIWRRLQPYLPYSMRSVFQESSDFHFDPNIFKISGQVYLVGYWQSGRYFKDIETILRQELTLKDLLDPINQTMLRLINQVDSVSLHIRRTDYVSNLTVYQRHGVCSLDYYQSAVGKLSNSIRHPHFFVFSDDIEWSQQNLRLNYPVTYVTHNGMEKDYIDLYLMSQCKHHITANSSFSWWGAWLNPESSKMVFVPRQWFNHPHRNTDDLIPEGWVRI